MSCIMLDCASCHVCCVFTMWFASFRLCFFSIVHVSLRSWGFVRLRLVRLRGFVFFMDSFFFLAGSQARWPLPSIPLLSLLASCSLYRYVALPTTCLSCLPYCHVKPLTFFLANRCLAKLPLLLSPLIALLVAGEVEDCSMLEQDYVRVSQYLLF